MLSTDEQLLAWIGGYGAATPDTLARSLGVGVAAAARRIRRLETAGLVRHVRLLDGRPPLVSVTAAGLRRAGRHDLAPGRISASTAAHLQACAEVGVALELEHPDAIVLGERSIVAAERAGGSRLVTVELGRGDGSHRPDLALWAAGSPIPWAIEVELTVKAPARLRGIVRAWARGRGLAGVVYYCAPAPMRAVAAAVAAEWAQDRVTVVPLEAAGRLPAPISTDSIPSAP